MNRGVIALAVGSALCMGLALGFLGGVFFSRQMLLHGEGGWGPRRIERRVVFRGPEAGPDGPRGERPAMPDKPAGARPAPRMALRHLQRVLDLTPAQSDAIRAEFERTADRMGSERDSLHARISSHLTPAQRDRFDRMLRDRFPGMIHGLGARPDRAVPGRGGESR